MGKRRRALWNMVNQKRMNVTEKERRKVMNHVELSGLIAEPVVAHKVNEQIVHAQESGRRMAERAVHHPLLESFGGLGKWESASGGSCGGRWAFDAEKQRGDCSTGNCAGKACQKGMKYFMIIQRHLMVAPWDFLIQIKMNFHIKKWCSFYKE